MHVVAKVASLLRDNLVRLEHLVEPRRAASDSQTELAATSIPFIPEETYIATDLFHIAACLATEFGSLRCFKIIEKLAVAYIELSLGQRFFQSLSSGAVSDHS